MVTGSVDTWNEQSSVWVNFGKEKHVLLAQFELTNKCISLQIIWQDDADRWVKQYTNTV